ncbi:PREDICTED: ubiquitin carboxyl-terminal hydrolase 42-like isoform X2 [Lepidothrix coronata]|uniref:Ubiquitin carboxyl-terminal hydrolase 42-like isoform X2 n=1 Tax=Lepidothrix coronata TaxID=321398 RepID=A0A6J0IXU7_9PASS|nr:PREDICTED: ubiquitin carboxyl-terminal hydrolase 42-like isoform X2 [Lepidothrix coronata]
MLVCLPFSKHFSSLAAATSLTKTLLTAQEKICMDWHQRQRPGAGLLNLGNTCYINVILQCLTYTPPLANYLLSHEHSQSCQQQGFCMMCVMEVHIRKVLHSSASAILPGVVLRDLKFIGEEFESGRAGDAYEFLRCALNAMQRACLSSSSDSDISSQETTIVHQIFGGFMRSRVTCLSCQAVTDSYKAFLDVSLDIRAASSLTTVLEDCVTPKELDLKECFKCRKCKKKVAASKRVTIHQAPRVLTLCLERADQWTGKKISKFVDYPEYLDLRPYMSDTAGEPLLCSLYAIVVHSGDTCLEGHFFCYTKASNGLWYKMDDESVDSCDTHTVLGQQAYLLFYARCSNLKMGEMVASSPAPSYVHSILSQTGGSSEQAGSAGPQALPGRIKVTHSQRNSARERARSRSPQWGNDLCSCFMNSTDYDNSTGRRRKRTSSLDCNHAPRDNTAPGLSDWICQRTPAPSAAWVQTLPIRRSSWRGYDIWSQVVEITNSHQSVRRFEHRRDACQTNTV